MNMDKIATYGGLLLGGLHQVGIVGVVPQTKQDYINTGISLLMIFLGYVTNKTGPTA